jgi:hypothetical protein
MDKDQQGRTRDAGGQAQIDGGIGGIEWPQRPLHRMDTGPDLDDTGAGRAGGWLGLVGAAGDERAERRRKSGSPGNGRVHRISHPQINTVG